ncbi:hypothetical protein [Nodosilinea sp. P-1105]|uniref:hypothetical protein n=1 Tax=Nodosilinea sp. P-1105 TaxID=2546229 RepID=UPI00146E0740|nr:hypothetical protein [Nodosilinea sp. P-1105]NMF85472.1 hypothetical protein [Nodosilinea sp. P-1105]
MLKLSSLISIGCLMGVVLLAGGTPALAQPCMVDCGSGQIQFTPGDAVTVQVVNRSTVQVAVEQPPMIGPRTLRPGDTTELGFGWGTTPNISMFLWALRDQPVRVRLGRPVETTLTVEIYNAPSEPSDRSVYIENDGRVSIK